MHTIPPENRHEHAPRPGSVWDALWEPFGELPALFQRVARMTSDTLPGRAGRGWQPLVEHDKTDDAYVLRLELPGIAQERVHVEVDGRELSVSGETEEHERADGMLARRVGRFSHHAMLPSDAVPEQVSAAMARGVLTVTVPRNRTGSRRTVQVERDAASDSPSAGAPSVTYTPAAQAPGSPQDTDTDVGPDQITDLTTDLTADQTTDQGAGQGTDADETDADR